MKMHRSLQPHLLEKIITWKFPSCQTEGLLRGTVRSVRTSSPQHGRNPSSLGALRPRHDEFNRKPSPALHSSQEAHAEAGPILSIRMVLELAQRGKEAPELPQLQPRPVCLWNLHFTFSSQTSFWKHWDLTVSSQPPKRCPGPAGLPTGWRCRSLQREISRLRSLGRTHLFSAGPCGRVGAEGSAGPQSREG